jgi:hypothetical protein
MEGEKQKKPVMTPVTTGLATQQVRPHFYINRFNHSCVVFFPCVRRRFLVRLRLQRYLRRV